MSYIINKTFVQWLSNRWKSGEVDPNGTTVRTIVKKSWYLMYLNLHSILFYTDPARRPFLYITIISEMMIIKSGAAGPSNVVYLTPGTKKPLRTEKVCRERATCVLWPAWLLYFADDDSYGRPAYKTQPSSSPHLLRGRFRAWHLSVQVPPRASRLHPVVVYSINSVWIESVFFFFSLFVSIEFVWIRLEWIEKEYFVCIARRL